MTESAVDHEARRSAQKALDLIAGHEKVCEERARTSADFQTRTITLLDKIESNQREGLQRVHTRLDAIAKDETDSARSANDSLKGWIVSGAIAVLTGIVGAVWFLANKG